jgi:MFS transporter, DHA1 family, tetracycline resistance protein
MDYTRILPVLFLEFVILSMTKSLLPGMMLDTFGSYSYLAIGVMETLKGVLAFMSIPVIGKLSDKIGKSYQSRFSCTFQIYFKKQNKYLCWHTGRKYCLLVTVVGTCIPVAILAISPNIVLYSIAYGLSGVCAATFALTFAYISDCMEPKLRAPAYGMALATFGLSFTVGPIAGALLAAKFGTHTVFEVALVLLLLDIAYIITYLPESVKLSSVSSLHSYCFCSYA